MKSVRGVYENGKVKLRGRVALKGPVPVLVTFCGGGEKPSAMPVHRCIADHPSVGMWADRTDIGDSVVFSRKLREKAERRAGDR